VSSNRHIAAFYQARNFRPLWVRGSRLTPAGVRLFERLSSARLEGLDPDDYRLKRIDGALQDAQQGSLRDSARAEMLLTRALLSYVRDLHKPPRKKKGMAFVDKGLAPEAPPQQAILRAIGTGDSLDNATLMHPVYNQLRAGYAAWRARWRDLPSVAVPSGPSLSSGSKGERVRLLRHRLGLPAGTSFDKKVAAAVREFRAAHGLPAGSVADAQTIALLNETRSRQEARIQVNLERARQLPSPLRGRHVLVDAASQRLWMYEGGRVRDEMRVVVGKPEEPTPMMAGLIRYAALNPYWYVPPDLVAKRVAPGVLSEGLAFLQDKGYQVLSDWSERPRPVDPATVDWHAVATGRVELPVRQLPGPANMMGAMKFMFPNEYGVYLHDTPDKDLFGLADRRRSSGCVRVQDARRLAKWLFGQVPTANGFAAEQYVPLSQPVPVYITYLTAVPQAQGIAFRDDVYHRDTEAVTRLARAK
jgi:murein L,D-transpeptidase YcbB/YkuD